MVDNRGHLLSWRREENVGRIPLPQPSCPRTPGPGLKLSSGPLRSRKAQGASPSCLSLHHRCRRLPLSQGEAGGGKERAECRTGAPCPASPHSPTGSGAHVCCQFCSLSLGGYGWSRLGIADGERALASSFRSCAQWLVSTCPLRGPCARCCTYSTPCAPCSPLESSAVVNPIHRPEHSDIPVRGLTGSCS